VTAGHVREALGAYVLGALEPDEAAEVRAHVERCPDCAAEHARLARLPALLSLAAAVEEARREPLAPAVEERVLDRFAREHAGRRERRRAWRGPRRRVALLGGALAAAVAAAAVALGLFTGGGTPAPAYELSLRPTGAAPAARARVDLDPLPGGTRVHMWVQNLPRNVNAVYEVRCEGQGWSASAGTFRADASGRAYVVLTTAARRGEYDSIRVVRRYRDPGGRVRTAEVLSGRVPS
jgi:anti-sigma factor RsiW